MKSRLASIFLIAVCLTSGSALAQSPPPNIARPTPASGQEPRTARDPFETVYAVINNEPITTRDIAIKQRQLAKMAEGEQPTDAEGMRMLWQQALIEVIRDKLLAQIATKEDVRVDRDVEARLRLERQRAGSEKNFLGALDEQGITLEELEQSLEESFKARNYLSTYVFGDRVKLDKRPSVDMNVSPSELFEYYREHREDKFTKKAEAHLRQVYLSNALHGGLAASRALANQVRNRFKDGEPFPAIAADLDDFKSRRKNGDLGWVELNADSSDYPKEVLDFARGGEAGSLSTPSETEFGVYVTWIEEKREARVIPFAEVQDEIHEELWNRKYSVYVGRRIRRLLDEAVIHPEQLARALRR